MSQTPASPPAKLHGYSIQGRWTGTLQSPHLFAIIEQQVEASSGSDYTEIPNLLVPLNLFACFCIYQAKKI